MTVLAVVLAAGAGSRFVGPDHKLLAELGDGPVVEHAIRAAVDAGIGAVVVITGAIRLDDVIGRFAHRTIPVAAIHNPDWADGQATSLQRAIHEARRRDVDSIVVGLGDQPFVAPDAWRAVAAGEAPIAVAEYGGRRRNPVKLDREVWDDLPTTGDEGARRVIRLKPHLVQPIPCQGSAADIDTWEDLQSWQSRSSTNSP